MSVWGEKGSYSATVAVVTVWIGLSALAYFGRPFIDREKNAELEGSNSSFMQAGVFQRVNWREWGEDVVMDARRLDKPLLIFRGYVWGEERARIDGLLGVPEVAEFLNQEFVCVRIDELTSPAWRAEPAPLARAELGETTDFSMMVYTPRGVLMAAPDRVRIRGFDEATLLGYMRGIVDQRSKAEELPISVESRREADMMRGGVSSAESDLTQYLQITGGRIRRADRLFPYEMELLLDEGKTGVIVPELEQLLTSPVIDVLGGGFFERWRDGDDSIEFNQTGFSNAAMLRVLARAAATTTRPDLRAAAVWHFRFIEQNFAKASSSSHVSVEWELGRRAPHFSISRSDLLDQLDSAQLERATEIFGLGVRSNVQALPRFDSMEDWLAVDSEDVERLRVELMALRKSRSQISGILPSFESQAESIEAMLVAARVLGDQELQSRALLAFGELKDRMRTGRDEVVATSVPDMTISAGLGTYLSYVSAAYEAYLLSGNEAVAEDGLGVLNRAIFLFQDEEGVFWPGQISQLNEEWRRSFSPVVMDGGVRSPIGQLLRLTDRYSAWSGVASSGVGLRTVRRRIFGQLSWLVDQGIFGIGNFARGARQVDQSVTVAVGEGCDWGFWEKNYPGVPLVRQTGLVGADWRLFRNGAWITPSGYRELDELLR